MMRLLLIISIPIVWLVWITIFMFGYAFVSMLLPVWGGVDIKTSSYLEVIVPYGGPLLGFALLFYFVGDYFFTLYSNFAERKASMLKSRPE